MDINSIEEQILKQRAEELKIQKRFSNAYSEDTGLEYFILKFGESTYAVAMNDIFEITELIDSIPLPCSPRHLLGIINLRGDILPLFDISSFIGISETKKTSDFKIAVVGVNDSFAGVIVDEVIEKYHYTEEKIHRIDTSKKSSAYVLGAINWNNKSMPLLNIKKLMVENKLLSEG